MYFREQEARGFVGFYSFTVTERGVGDENEFASVIYAGGRRSVELQTQRTQTRFTGLT